MSTSFAFKNAVFLVKGPLEMRMNHLVNIIMISQLYNFNFKIVWDTTDFPYKLEDITHAELFFGRLVENFDFLTDTSYFYNPAYTVKQILSSTIANGLEENFPDLNLMCCDWLVIDNLPSVRNEIVPNGILKYSDFNKKTQQIYKLLQPSATITGQISLFSKLLETSTIAGVYISVGDDITDFIDFLKTFDYHYFFAISNHFQDDEKISIESSIRNTIHEDKCMFVKQESYKNIINFFCLKECPIIFTYFKDDEYTQEASVENMSIVYNITTKTIRNTEPKYLQTILPQKHMTE